MVKLQLIFSIFALGCLIAIPTLGAQEVTPGEELFVRRVMTLLSEKCWACHGDNPDELAGGLDLKSRDGAFKGGDSGQAVTISGASDRSPIMLAVRRDDQLWPAMPPKESQRLSPEDIKWLAEWIDHQAPWPDAQRIEAIKHLRSSQWQSEDGVVVQTSGGLSSQWNERRYRLDALWAYRPVQMPQTHASGPAAIDELLARTWAAGAPVADAADAGTFLRRATLDLTGLPPTQDQLEQFKQEYAHDADDAVARCIDRLLASPHYGERMAQHWLDVARYADSSGFSNDYARGTAWRYRDYVVRSFNNDKPYDQFIVEQIAGDELWESQKSHAAVAGTKNNLESELLVAVGFLRMGPWELTGMEVPKIARQRFLDDVTGSVGETFLAHSLQCARCHDHKFDPIPTRDYYSLQAVFATTQMVDRPAEFHEHENVSGFEEQRYLEMSRNALQAMMEQLDAKSLLAAEAWLTEHSGASEIWKVAIDKAQATTSGRKRGVYAAARSILLKDGVPEDQIPPRMLGWTPQEIGLERIANKGLERLVWEFDRYQPVTLSVFNGPTPHNTSVNAPIRMPQRKDTVGEVESMHILSGGDPFSLGDPVEPAVLSAVESLAGWHYEIPRTESGRRLALARWIADSRNPLSARVIANRLWLWHFDTPLAGNPNNFGSTGKRPTHPELLDWLAATLVENQWSVKSLHRAIMNTRAYRRSAQTPVAVDADELANMQAEHRLFKPRRLSAEEIRDSMLMVSGELDRTVGGIPVRPEINTEVALQPRQVMGTFAAAWVPSPLPHQRHRRSLYTLRLRGLVDPALEVFNAPVPDFSCERREVSTVTPQVFQMLNSSSTSARALAVAQSVLKEPAANTNSDDRAVVASCFLRILGRQPDQVESDACIKHWSRMTKTHEGLDFRQTQPPLEIVREAIEENTGERFTYTEKLYSNSDFVADLQPADCDARTRGLSEVCLVLLNSNEFMYVY